MLIRRIIFRKITKFMFKNIINQHILLLLTTGSPETNNNFFEIGQKKLIVIPTTNLLLTLKSNTMKNSMQN